MSVATLTPIPAPPRAQPARGRERQGSRVPHPMLRPGTPVLARGADAVQVGFSLVLSDAPRGAVTALRLLDGSVPLTHVAARASVDVDWLRGAVAELERAGAVSRTTRARVAVAGSGRLAAAVSEALSDAHLVSAWSPHPAPDVVVVAADAAPPRQLCDALVGDAVAHLVVAPSPGGASVGPFVAPGKTACQRCCDLTLAARDPWWPALVVQAESHEAAPSAAAVAWAAGLAASHVDAYVRGREPASLGCAWELCDGDIGVRRFPRHPDCSCAGIVAARDGRPWY